MPFRLKFQPTARIQKDDLERLDFKKFKKVRKCLAHLEQNPLYPGLKSHRYVQLDAVHGERIWESYVENQVSAAWRVFWHYGPEEGEITVVAITSHP